MIRLSTPGLRAFIAASAVLALNLGVYGTRSCPHHTGVATEVEERGEAPAERHAHGSPDHASSTNPTHSDHGSDSHGGHEECTCVGTCVVVGVATMASGATGPSIALPSVRDLPGTLTVAAELPPRFGPFQLPLANAPPLS